jgi:hypothetical protein
MNSPLIILCGCCAASDATPRQAGRQAGGALAEKTEGEYKQVVFIWFRVLHECTYEYEDDTRMTQSDSYLCLRASPQQTQYNTS